MNQASNRVCRIKGHTQYKAQQICVYQKCINGSRWACQQCLRENRHLHGQFEQSHLINLQDFKKFLRIKSEDTQEEIKLYKKELQDHQNIISQVTNFLNALQNLKKQFQQFIEEFKEKQIRFLYVQTYSNMELERISDDVLTELIEFQPHLYKNQNIIALRQHQYQFIDELKDQLLLFLNRPQLKIQKQESNTVNNDKQDLQQFVDFFQFENQIIYQGYNFQIRTSTLSDDGKYFYYTSGKLTTTLLDINKNITNTFTLLDIVNTSLFSQTNQFLVCGCQNGKLFAFDLQNQFKKFQIEKQGRSPILQISNLDKIHIISITQFDQDFFVINLIDRSVINRINISDFIRNIDIDYFNNCVIACTDKNQIIVYPLEKGKYKFILSQAHQQSVVQVQIILKQNILISLGEKGDIKKGKLDYQLRQFIEIGHLTKYEAFSISIINQLQKIVIICQLEAMVLDYDFLEIQKINHGISEIEQKYIAQNNSLSYLNIRGKKKLRLMQNKDGLNQ